MNRRTFLLTPLALAAAGKQPDVVLVTARGWRGVSTPWTGDPDIHAPNLAAFARDAVVFPRAYCADPDPDRARSAIFSGRFPHIIQSAELTIQAALEDAGYQTKARRSPFFLSVTLEPKPTEQLDPASFHVRPNVPLESMEKARDELAAAYSGYASMDQQFGELLASIDASKTIVIFTSDCGAQINSHGLEDSESFYEESLRVPLAIRFPGVIRPGASEVHASHVDLFPTILGLCGIPPIDSRQGHNLSPLITTGEGDRPEWVFAEGRLGQRDEWRMIVLGVDKLVVNAAGEVTHLFNLALDPHENADLAHAPGLDLKRAQLMAQMHAARSKLADFRRRSVPLQN